MNIKEEFEDVDELEWERRKLLQWRRFLWYMQKLKLCSKLMSLKAGSYLQENVQMLNELKPDKWEINAREPESMSVGKLNNVVRALREQLHIKQIRIQELEAKIVEIEKAK